MSTPKKLIGLFVTLLAVLLVAAVLFLLCYQYDNKYKAKGPQPLVGVLMLDNDALERYPVVYLVRDWEIYRGKLLAPEDFANNSPAPDELVFIGQYGGFEGHVDGNAKRSPHGNATYRLNIALPAETRSYTLELPEIYSAYKLYVNDLLMAEMGETDPESYRPQTGNSFVTVQAAGRMEILIAVSDYDHFYSGMVYPPAFGQPSAVARLLNVRLVLRAAADAIAVCVGLLSLCIWLLTKKENAKNPERLLPLHYALLCACFALYTCYPIVKTLIPIGMGWYSVENFSYCAMFLFVMLIQRRLTDTNDKLFKPFAAFAVFVCCWALSVPLIMVDSLNLMTAYSRLIGLYARVCALYLTAGAAYGVYRGAVYSKIMLAGIASFDAALIMDRLLPMYEPIRFGWFAELAGGLLVLLTGFVMAQDIARQYRLRQSMEVRVESVSRMLDVERAYYPVILEREEEVRAARHDLRHHIAAIRQFVSQSDIEELRAYLDVYEDKHEQAVPVAYCEHYVANMLLRMYAGLAQRQGMNFHVHARLPKAVPVDDTDLCVILSNLLENALEASARLPAEQRNITVSIGYEPLKINIFGIFIENRFDGVVKEKDGRFHSRKQRGREGVGLSSVRAVCKNYGGKTDFYADESGVFHSEVYIPIGQSLTK